MYFCLYIALSMDRVMLIRSSITLLLFAYLRSASSDDVQGCGGYVKSDVEIDFSQVGIKLYTSSGSLKYETDCAPNDGYYFMPIYDKGDYLIKVSPPSGWSVEPEEVPVSIDGHSDVCSTKTDVNFYFKGFAVLGQVVSAGDSSRGPEGVIVSLHKASALIQTTKTDSEGKFSFTPLGSGQYDLTLAHNKWSFIKESTSVMIKDSNGKVPRGSLIVKGYSLSGVIEGETSSSPKPKGAVVLLVGDASSARHYANHPPGCQKGEPKGYRAGSITGTVVCHTKTDSKGQFVFNDIIPGSYHVTVLYASDLTTFTVSPESLSAKVTHSDAKLAQNFKVAGFKASGRVVNGKGQPIQGALVNIPKMNLHLKTNQDGKFYIENAKTDRYQIMVEVAAHEFSTVSASLSSTSPSVADISPSRYQSCFRVMLDKPMPQQWSISISSGNSEDLLIVTDKAGVACTMLKQGDYKATVVLTKQQQQQGIRFGPTEHSFSVSNSPVKDMSFSQFLGEVSVSVSCLSACPSDISVSLSHHHTSEVVTEAVAKASAKTAVVTFKEVVPGNYEVMVTGSHRENWCWRQEKVSVEVNVKNTDAVLHQTGYQLSLSASHQTKVVYSTKGDKGEIAAKKGVTKTCLSTPGTYTLSPEGCHQFVPSTFSWVSSHPRLITMVAKQHRMRGSITTKQTGAFRVKLSRDDGSVEELAAAKEGESYHFSFLASNGETVSLSPFTPDDLFQYEPQSLEVTAPNDCTEDIATFTAQKALFIQGKVSPPVSGVAVKVTAVGDSSISHSFTTDSKGQYSAGPLDNSLTYDVTASLTGYTITPTDHLGNFEAFKLAEVVVVIGDSVSQEPLDGVVVSMSGGKAYRQNRLTDEKGAIVFHSLLPGDYFLRCSMKEYNFDPPNQMIKIEEGESITIHISAIRVAYSALGTVTSLTGVPEGDVALEAVGQGSCGDYNEETVSHSTQGTFRIRGLNPDCSYKVQLKEGVTANKHIDKMMPASTTVQVKDGDITDINLTVLRHFNQLDVMGNIESPKEFLKSLSIKVYREDVPDSPLHTVKITDPFFMLPPMIIDRKVYTLRLESTLPRSQYSYHNPEISFAADTSFRNVKLTFKPTLKSMDGDMNQNTMASLLLTLTIIALMYNYERIGPAIEIALEMFSNALNRKSAPSGGEWLRKQKSKLR